MKIINLLYILLFQFMTIANAYSQEIDSIVYDLIDLKGLNDRIPEFYSCIDSGMRVSVMDYSNNFINVKLCLSRNLDYPLNNLRDPIKSISLHSGDGLMYDRGFISRKRYVSIFKLELDDKGRVSLIETIRHCIDAVSENDLRITLKNTIWKTALKDLKPVKSRLIIEIEFDASLCHQETWVKKQTELYRRFPEYRKELMSTYLEKGTMWDVGILTPMMKFENENQLSSAFDAIEEQCKIHIDSLNMEFVKNNVEACLLYTSPSPRDATLSRMPSSA